MSICSAGDRSRENRLLQGKSNRNVFGSASCFRTGIFASENLFQNNNNSEILILVMFFCLLMKVVIEIPHIFVQTLVYCLSVFDDWVRVEGDQVLMVPLLHVLHLVVFHTVWDDDCCSNTRAQRRRYSLHHVLCLVESFLRIHHSQNSKFRQS